jgi:hypothetical protein
MTHEETCDLRVAFLKLLQAAKLALYWLESHTLGGETE